MKKKTWILPLIITICTGIIILTYWLGAYLYNEKNRGLSAAELLAVNPDYMGTIEIPGLLKADVVQGQNNSFYLTHAFDKTENKYGCPFIDAKWSPASSNLVIYGHNNLNGTAFSDLVQYDGGQNFVQEHSEIVFTDKEGVKHLYNVLAVLNFDVSMQDYTNPYSLTLPENYFEMYRRYSLFIDSTAVISPNEKYITLSTCFEKYHGKNGRIIVIGKENRPA